MRLLLYEPSIANVGINITTKAFVLPNKLLDSAKYRVIIHSVSRAILVHLLTNILYIIYIIFMLRGKSGKVTSFMLYYYKNVDEPQGTTLVHRPIM
jgi:membrane associated rhomboid family serine protease